MSDQLDEIIKKIKKKVVETLEDEVATEVVRTMQKHIADDVYAVYDPKQYERTYKLMTDIEVEVKDDTLIVSSERYDGDKYVSQVVETGEGYDYTGYAYAYEEPRPFAENTRKELEEKKNHVKALKKGLRKRGLKVK